MQQRTCARQRQAKQFDSLQDHVTQDDNDKQRRQHQWRQSLWGAGLSLPVCRDGRPVVCTHGPQNARTRNAALLTHERCRKLERAARRCTACPIGLIVWLGGLGIPLCLHGARSTRIRERRLARKTQTQHPCGKRDHSCNRNEKAVRAKMRGHNCNSGRSVTEDPRVCECGCVGVWVCVRVRARLSV